jgi:nucleoid-associated protein YgaU
VVKPHDDLSKQGWVPIKHSGGEAVKDVQREVPGLDEEPAPGISRAGTTDPSAHADKEQSFDVEAPPARATAATVGGAAAMGAGRSIAAVDDPAVARSARSEGKLDTVLHKVEKNENFWTIARMYYNSGRYYKALWKANEDKVPEIDKLYRNTVIRIPPPEDLDPAFILPPGTRSPNPGAEKLTAQDADPDRSTAGRSTSADGVPIRRSSRSDAELNLPVSDAASEEADGSVRSARQGARSATAIRDNGEDNREPEIRPRDAVTRPIYKVRPYDTLRTIARDTLGDSRRADEILELNRDIIDAPSHLIVGQILDLPEDARPGRSRSRR